MQMQMQMQIQACESDLQRCVGNEMTRCQDAAQTVDVGWSRKRRRCKEGVIEAERGIGRAQGWITNLVEIGGVLRVRGT